MNKIELLKHIGSIEQIGGIRDITYNSGREKGVRAIEINTGIIRFVVLLDRGMDIAQAFYKNTSVSWISKTGIVSPAYYEKDGTNFLRGFFGGLVTTCGLKNIGRPYGEMGLHGRISNIPAENVSISSEWVQDDFVMTVSGQMRESIVDGENLVLKRKIQTKLFSNEITLSDTVVNEGFANENIALCYHCNFGYPLVCDGAKIVNVPDEFSDIPAPLHGAEEECIDVKFKDETVTVGIENEKIGAYITYNTKHLPDFLIWKMPGEGDYAIGLEPRTTSYGGINIEKNNKYVCLEPFEKLNTMLHFKFCEL